MSKRTWGLLAVTALVAAACGNGGTTETTDSPPATTVDSTAPSQSGASDATTTTTDAPDPSGDDTAPAGDDTAPAGDDTAPAGDEEGSIVVTVGDAVYELSVADDIQIPGTTSSYRTRCDPDRYEVGQFVAAAVAESDGTLLKPGASLILSLPHDPDDEDPVEAPELQLTDETIPLTYYTPTNDRIESELGEFEGDLGTWTVEGNRIHGEFTTVTLDPVEYYTVQFDVTCPG